MRISDWSSDVCSSDLGFKPQEYWSITAHLEADGQGFDARLVRWNGDKIDRLTIGAEGQAMAAKKAVEDGNFTVRSEERTSELQSLMRISYAVFCLNKQNKTSIQDT